MHNAKDIVEIITLASACTSTKDAALTLAKHGNPVIPCNSDKTPLTPHGFKDATTDEVKVRDAWDAFPDALIGIPTGALTGIVVIDLDNKKGKNGEDEFARIMSGESTTNVPTVLTPSGGKHLYFAYPGEKVKSTSDVLASGVDTRGDGGYIIVPPSRTDAGHYTVLHSAPLGPIPPKLYAALKAARIIGESKALPNDSDQTEHSPAEVAHVNTALHHLDPDLGYWEWLQIGMALHDWDKANGLEIWDTWSKRSSKYVAGETARKWDSFSVQNQGSARITIRTLFAMARKRGYVHGLPILGVEDTLAIKYGSPIICKSEKQCDVNQVYLAAFHVQKTGLIFDSDGSGLWEYDAASGLWLPRSESILLQQLSESYQQVLFDHNMGHLLASRTTRILQQIATLVRGMAYKKSPFIQNGSYIHVANGMLHIQPNGDIQLLPFAPDYYSRNRSEIAWDPNSQCPEFLASLHALMDDDDCDVLQRYFGQCLLGRNISQTIMIMRGPAATMKSTTQRILVLLVGVENIETLRPEHLGGRFEQSRFAGRTLLIAADVSAEFMASESANALKALVGGDTIFTERKGVHERVMIRGVFNVCVTSNVDLRIKLDGDRAAWDRRLIILDLEGRKSDRHIPDFAAHVIAREGPGILRWAVVGAAAMLRDTMSGFSAITLNERQKARVNDLLSQSDSIGVFVSTCIVRDEAASVSGSKLFDEYEAFCDMRGWTPVSKRQFERTVHHELMAKFHAVKSHSVPSGFTQVRGFRGVRLVNPIHLDESSNKRSDQNVRGEV